MATLYLAQLTKLFRVLDALFQHCQNKRLLSVYPMVLTAIVNIIMIYTRLILITKGY